MRVRRNRGNQAGPQIGDKMNAQRHLVIMAMTFPALASNSCSRLPVRSPPPTQQIAGPSIAERILDARAMPKSIRTRRL